MTPARDRAAAQSEAQGLADQLESIRRALRAAAWEHAQKLPDQLTAPQVQTLKVLVDHLRDTGDGLSLSGLSQRLGLAHSTVSGIVTRLEQRGLMRRTPHPADRRYVQVELTGPVRGWVKQDLPDSRVELLSSALADASPEQRAAILSGVRALAQLLDHRDDVISASAG